MCNAEKYDFPFDLWDESYLRSVLESEEGRSLRQLYFGSSPKPGVTFGVSYDSSRPVVTVSGTFCFKVDMDFGSTSDSLIDRIVEKIRQEAKTAKRDILDGKREGCIELLLSLTKEEAALLFRAIGEGKFDEFHVRPEQCSFVADGVESCQLPEIRTGRRATSSRLMSLLSDDICIDMGFPTSLVSVRGQGVALDEPSLVAVSSDTGDVLAAGEEASRMLGRAPGTIRALHVTVDLIADDPRPFEAMIRHLIGKAKKRTKPLPPRLIIAIPPTVTGSNSQKIKETALRAGCREVIALKEPVAIALAIGAHIPAATGKMIVDIGATKTEIIVISLSGIVESRPLKVGDETIVSEIIKHLKHSHGILVGSYTAQTVKVKIGSALPGDKSVTMQVRGRDLEGGLPRDKSVTADEICRAIAGPIALITDAIQSTLERCPAELASDLVDEGITLTGSGAMLDGLDRHLAAETGLAVTVADTPSHAVVQGLEIYAESLAGRR